MNEELKTVYVSAPTDTDKIIVETLELLCDSFSAPIRITNQKSDFTATLESTAPVDASTSVTFTATEFNLKRPSTGDNPTQTFDIKISNIDKLASGTLEQAIDTPNKITMIYRVYVYGTTSGPAIDPPAEMALESAVADSRMLVAKARTADVINKPFPTIVYDANNFPGLIR